MNHDIRGVEKACSKPWNPAGLGRYIMIGVRSTKGLVSRMQGVGPLLQHIPGELTEIGRHTRIHKEGAPGKMTRTRGRETQSWLQ